MEEFTLTATDGFPVSCALFESSVPNDRKLSPSGIVQIIHGAKEYKERYYDFASFLASSGFIVVLSDLRGHGKSVNDEYPFGHMGRWQVLANDIAMISNFAKTCFAEEDRMLPLTLFAHSFGSVLARCCLRQNDQVFSKLIMTGTVRCLSHAKYIVPLSKVIVSVQGGLKPAGFPLKYGEPLPIDQDCSVMKYSNTSVLTIWEANLAMQSADWTAKKPYLSILSLTCSDDPVTGGKHGLEETAQHLYSQGYRNYRSITYPESGHQPLMSGARQQALEDIISFLHE